MSNQESPSRRYLLSYKLIEELDDFFSSINSVAYEYAFVSATERRCFNLVARFMPGLANLVSNSGLLLHYRELATFYEINGYLPRILIVDDIMVHGRGIAKLLSQLEKMLSTELMRRGILNSDEDHYYFRRMFTRAVDIFIYAKSRQDILIEDRFLKNVKCWKILSPSELRDLSQQLSDSLVRAEIANTSFVFSARCRMLTNKLVKNSEAQPYSNCGNWVCVPWKYQNEDMILYIRLYGSRYVKRVNRISTIRYFPQRSTFASPQITSFSLMGDLEASDLAYICNSLSAILDSKKYPCICKILSEEDYPVIQQSKGQLISFLLSIIDFNEFISTIKSNFINCVSNTLTHDLSKIARNFGKSKEIQTEFSSIISDWAVLENIKFEMDTFLARCAAPLINVPPTMCDTINTLDFDDFNKLVEFVFYNVGANAEQDALKYSGRPYLFSPENYQNYSFRKKEYGEDGVISFADFFNIVSCNAINTPPENIYRLLAAYIAIMDNGIMGVRMHYINDGLDSRLVTLSKAGEMATFYYPRLFSMYIPAFARIEWRSYLTGLSEADAITAFFRERNHFELDEVFNQQDKEKWISEYAPHCPNEFDLLDALNLLSRCSQSFSGWNFKNLTYQTDKLQRRYQWFLEKKAMEFLGLQERVT